MGGNRLIQLVFSPNEKVICFALILATTLATIAETAMNKGIQMNS